MAHASTTDTKLIRAAIAGGVTFIVLTLALWAIPLPDALAGYDFAARLVASLVVFLGVLTS